ncbi:hypothetical protein FGG08_004270 [Glutinoglossum americanum]|uniref:Uncharacterized protein n=1 Tax=Glutinoglossum americanum TaxID=1670608 RepID=A0A9P8KZR8_9PEZI|nr:hypothetical protein FGG08_004270 [Glutinoglossum americanum]
MATARVTRVDKTPAVRNIRQAPHTMSPRTPRKELDNGKVDPTLAGPSAVAPKKTNKALSSLGSSYKNTYVQGSLASVLDTEPHFSNLFKFLALSPTDEKGQTSHEAAGFLKSIGAWTFLSSWSNVVGQNGHQDGDLSGDMTLRTQCPYHRNHDAEPINAVLCQRSFHGATAPNCICRDSPTAAGLGLGGRGHSPTPDAVNGLKPQPRLCHRSPRQNPHDAHGQHVPTAPRLIHSAIDNAPRPDTTTAKSSTSVIPISSHEGSTTQSPRDAPGGTSPSFPAGTEASPGDSTAPSSARQALTLTTVSTSPSNHKKRTRRDDSQSPSRGKKPASRNRNTTRDRFPCIYYVHDPIKFKSCEERDFPGFKTLKAHVFEHVRRYQCIGCGMRVGKEDNLRKHWRNTKQICQQQPPQAWLTPPITSEETTRFLTISAAGEGGLERAVFSPTALFEKDNAIRFHQPRKPSTAPPPPHDSPSPPSSPSSSDPSPPHRETHPHNPPPDAALTCQLKSMAERIAALEAKTQRPPELEFTAERIAALDAKTQRLESTVALLLEHIHAEKPPPQDLRVKKLEDENHALRLQIARLRDDGGAEAAAGLSLAPGDTANHHHYHHSAYARSSPPDFDFRDFVRSSGDEEEEEEEEGGGEGER